MRFAFSRWILTAAATIGLTMATGCKSGPSLAWFKKDAPSEEYAVQTTQGEPYKPPSTQFQPGPGTGQQYASTGSAPYPNTRTIPNGPGGVQAGPYEDGRSPYSGGNVAGAGFNSPGSNPYQQTSGPSCAGCLSGYCAVHGGAAPAADPYRDGGARTADQRNGFGGSTGYQSDSRGFGGSTNFSGGNTAPPSSDYPPSSSYPPESSYQPYGSQGNYDSPPSSAPKSYGPQSSSHFGADSPAYGQEPYQPNTTPPQFSRNDGDWAGPGSVRQANYDRKPVDSSYDSHDSGSGFGGGGSFGASAQQPPARQPW